MKTRLLLLGGTTESLALADRLAGDGRVEVITSLAGRTVAHRLPPGHLRVGGFGGAAGLSAYLREERIGLVIDATHPFAATISRNAAAACAEVGVPRLQVLRPEWTAGPGDRWIEVADMTAAAAALPGLGATAFLAVGRQELPAFAGLEGIRLIARMVDAPSEPLPLGTWDIILARGPFALADEEALIARYGVDVVVSKNSGGAPTYAKIAAARTRGLPVVMIGRPAPPPGKQAGSVDEALIWLTHTLTR